MSLSVRGSTPVGPAVIVANHISYLDPLVIGQTLPVSAVAKSEIMGWPAIGETLEEVEEYLAHGLLDCVECGLCTYVCPSKIELAATLQAAKHAYRKEQA